MTDNEIIKALEVCSYATSNKDCEKCPYYPDEECVKKQFTDILDLINRQKSEIEKLNKECDELVEKIEQLLCNVTGYKLSKHTYPIKDMICYADDYTNECCDEAVEEAKTSIKSEAIKEFAETVRRYIKSYCNPYGKPTLDYDTSVKIMHFIDNLVKEMTEVQK